MTSPSGSGSAPGPALVLTSSAVVGVAVSVVVAAVAASALDSDTKLASRSANLLIPPAQTSCLINSSPVHLAAAPEVQRIRPRAWPSDTPPDSIRPGPLSRSDMQVTGAKRRRTAPIDQLAGRKSDSSLASILPPSHLINFAHRMGPPPDSATVTQSQSQSKSQFPPSLEWPLEWIRLPRPADPSQAANLSPAGPPPDFAPVSGQSISRRIRPQAAHFFHIRPLNFAAPPIVSRP